MTSKENHMIEIVQAETIDQLEQVRRLKRAFLVWLRETYPEHIDLLDEYYDPVAFEDDLTNLPGEFAPPTGALLLAYVEGTAAGTVALRDLGDRVCEMKAMFVEREYQSKGVGRALGEEILAAGQKKGYRTMRLDTGPRQIAAQSLYRSLGFKQIGPYYPLPERIEKTATFMEIDLTSSDKKASLA